MYSVNQQQQQQQQQQNYNTCFGPTSRASRNFFSWVSFNIITVCGPEEPALPVGSCCTAFPPGSGIACHGPLCAVSATSRTGQRLGAPQSHVGAHAAAVSQPPSDGRVGTRQPRRPAQILGHHTQHSPHSTAHRSGTVPEPIPSTVAKTQRVLMDPRRIFAVESKSSGGYRTRAAASVVHRESLSGE